MLLSQIARTRRSKPRHVDVLEHTVTICYIGVVLEFIIKNYNHSFFITLPESEVCERSKLCKELENHVW